MKNRKVPVSKELAMYLELICSKAWATGSLRGWLIQSPQLWELCQAGQLSSKGVSDLLQDTQPVRTAGRLRRKRICGGTQAQPLTHVPEKHLFMHS